MWSDIYLKFPDYDTFMASLPQAMLTATGEPTLCAENFDMDIPGPFYTPATYDAEGNILTPTTERPGWHVNLKLRESMPLPEAFAPYVVTPLYPKRIFL